MPTIKKYRHRPKINLHIGMPIALLRPVFYGKCKMCGETFKSSKERKYFCRQECYTKSKQCALELRKRRAKELGIKLPKYPRQAFAEMKCAQCHRIFFVKPSRIGKELCCRKMCRRKYFAARFDRWVASPETLALPQNYDEFLTQDIMGCLVESCQWGGHNLSLHMNLKHGVPPDEFKKIAGFNFSSGIVSAPLHEKLSELAIRRGLDPRKSWERKHAHRPDTKSVSARHHSGRDTTASDDSEVRPADAPKTPNRVAWSRRTKHESLECAEHKRKSRTIRAFERLRAVKPCAVCKKKDAVGRSTCCSPKCYRVMKKKIMVCANCNVEFHAGPRPLTRALSGKPIFHSKSCASNWIAANRLQATGTLNGETKTLRDWARISKIPLGTIKHRIGKQGLSMKQAIETPQHKVPRKKQCGEDSHNAKLTWRRVSLIREKLRQGQRHLDIADAEGVSRTLISMINSGKAWPVSKRIEPQRKK